jgi:hypothetical protein
MYRLFNCDMTEEELITAFYCDIYPEKPNVYGNRYRDRPVGTRGRSIMDQFEELPNEYRKRAVLYTSRITLAKRACKLRDAISKGFDWGDTTEGPDFWLRVAMWGYPGCETLPDFP